MTVSFSYLLNGAPVPPDEVDESLPHELTVNTNHVDDGLSRFIEQYKDKPRLYAIAESFLIELQEAEDALYDVYTMRWLDSATGVRLATLGRIVGQPNPGLDDDNYRVLIRARIAANRSNGKPDELINIAILLVVEFGESPVDVQYTEVSGGWTIYFNSDIGTIDPDLLWDILDSADPVEVNGSIVYGHSPSSDLFRWGSSLGTVNVDGQGFSSTNTAAQGGVLSSTRGST